MAARILVLVVFASIMASVACGTSPNNAPQVSDVEAGPSNQPQSNNSTSALDSVGTPDQALFFEGVLNELEIARSEFAIDALIQWAAWEDTSAKWNPLATTWDLLDRSSIFNSVGVKDYVDSDAGVEATAKTLRKSEYDAIKDMLRQNSFSLNDVEQALNTWSGNGPYVPQLEKDWATLWSKRLKKNVSTSPPKGETPYEQLLSFIPDSPMNRDSVFINDYALLRVMFNVQPSPNEPTTGIDDPYFKTVASAGMAPGAWISGMSTNYTLMFLKNS
ncbi:MAG: hypothetical protein IH861_14610, partial [Chloroflexi bacterium]|nr:hypothetical protein [Chloroflexota bacterium]